MSTLWMFHTPRLVVKKGTQEEVEAADPKQQAELLCALLFTAMPSGVVRLFIDMIQADSELVFDIGNRVTRTHIDPVSTETKEKIKQHKGSTRQVAREFGISHTYVYKLRKQGD